LGSNAREIGYWIHAQAVNQGFATEVSVALTRVAFEIDQVDRVEIHCDPANIRSAAVPRKLGYTYEATLRRRIMLEDGKLRDSMIWCMQSDEYPASAAAQMKYSAYDAAGQLIDL
jgi:RimJ/RimL family protein N-acetyltransferase